MILALCIVMVICKYQFLSVMHQHLYFVHWALLHVYSYTHVICYCLCGYAAS